MRVETKVKNAIRDLQDKKPQTAVLYAIDDPVVSIRIGGSSSLLRNVQVDGDIKTLMAGQTINLRWEAREGTAGLVPVVLAVSSDGSASVAIASVVVDNQTIENSDHGIRVKYIGPEHLTFIPSLVGHTHTDLMKQAGWQLNDGVLFNGDTRIDPTGKITLGTGDDTVALSSRDDNYRLWAGNVDPELAPFSVSKVGAISASAGYIGGWDLLPTGFSADSGHAAILSGDYPAIRLGDATSLLAGVGFWLGKDTDGTYKMRIGDPAHDNMSWDGDTLYITGMFSGGSDIGYTMADQFTINYGGDLVDAALVIYRGITSMYLTWNGQIAQLNQPFRPVDLLISRISAATPTTTFAGMLWLQP